MGVGIIGRLLSKGKTESVTKVVHVEPRIEEPPRFGSSHVDMQEVKERIVKPLPPSMPEKPSKSSRKFYGDQT